MAEVCRENRPGLAAGSAFCAEGHMSAISFPRNPRVRQLGPALPADAILQRQGGKMCPSFLLVAKGPVVRGGFVWGVGVYPGRRLPGSWPRSHFCSGYSDYCPFSTLYFRGPELPYRGPRLWFLLLALAPHWHRRC
uniref:Uncharacterized protein n=1 Tax=Molossus molossus TaxID=27622 RepID=A0A7J8ERV5_MOLMO|nr:hypothetical protein HJG59_008774 [Molossus molossus]